MTGSISDIDYSGSKTLAELHSTLDERHIRLVLADLSTEVREQLGIYGLSDELGADAYQFGR
jgi:anti-anti-sigma regulatory factor